ncbi:unnamed protein product, partial [Notodromas monacha]
SNPEYKFRVPTKGCFRSCVTFTRPKEIRPFYNGLAPSLVRTFPATGVLFVVYEWSKKFLHNMFD